MLKLYILLLLLLQDPITALSQIKVNVDCLKSEFNSEKHSLYKITGNVHPEKV